MLGRMQSMGGVMTPDQVTAMRSSLETLFALKGDLLHQYLSFLKSVIVNQDFGLSLSMYPTPVSQLIGQALPWTLGLVLTSTVLAWFIGNFIGLLAGYFPKRVASRVFESVSMFLYPIPYFVLALILLIVFTYLVPIFPITTTIVGDGFQLDHIVSILYNSLLPALSIIIVGIGWWVISMKALSSDIVEEDFVQFAKLKGLSDSRVMGRYVLPNAMLPQITVLALQLGTAFGGALLTEVLFGYPGLGTLIYQAIIQSDYNLTMGAVALSVVAVAFAAFVIDVLYPFLDPRIRVR
jgi:peptide/nickel transport system permease protein